ncbi:MAG: hypothetical protein H6999_06745 [Hahellaceae bacterium]|nr:hypothetical protein [Hahellaceae bacterium]
MILPYDFIDSISAEALPDFLDHLIMSSLSGDVYEGNLVDDRARLINELRKGNVFIELSDDEESASFGLISKERARELGFG